MKLNLGLGVLLICASLNAFGKPEVVAFVESPSAILKVELRLDDGRLTYSIKRSEQPLITPSRLGFLLQGTISLDFLDPSARYRAEIYRDGDSAHYRLTPKDFKRKTTKVSAHSKMCLRSGPGGGIAIRLHKL